MKRLLLTILLGWFFATACAAVQPVETIMHGGDASVAGSDAPWSSPRALDAVAMSGQASPAEKSPAHNHGASLPGFDLPDIPKEGVGAILYSCPMHSDVVSVEPGTCPKCSMDLEPVAASEIYSCPMHVDVMSRVEGECPVCGMALVKRGADE